jgi:RNA-binding protein 5/10
VYNDGTGDVGDTPSQFLLVRNLDPMVQEEILAKGMARLDSEPKRVLLIRDRKTKISWGFAFIEYQDVSVPSSLPCNIGIDSVVRYDGIPESAGLQVI